MDQRSSGEENPGAGHEARLLARQKPYCETSRPKRLTQKPRVPARWASLPAQADSAGSRNGRHTAELGCLEGVRLGRGAIPGLPSKRKSSFPGTGPGLSRPVSRPRGCRKTSPPPPKSVSRVLVVALQLTPSGVYRPHHIPSVTTTPGRTVSPTTARARNVAAVVEDPHPLAVGDAATRGVARVDLQARLAGRLAQRVDVDEGRVQERRLRRAEHLQRIAGRQLGPRLRILVRRRVGRQRIEALGGQCGTVQLAFARRRAEAALGERARSPWGRFSRTGPSRRRRSRRDADEAVGGGKAAGSGPGCQSTPRPAARR